VPGRLLHRDREVHAIQAAAGDGALAYLKAIAGCVCDSSLLVQKLAGSGHRLTL